jgi:osmotically-inducible protein OsmY
LVKEKVLLINNLKQLYKYALIIAALLLTSCIAAVIAGAAGGMVVYDKRNLITIEKDTRIYSNVNRAIFTDQRLRHSHIEVTAFNQVVLLTGETPDPLLRVLAEKIARKTAHVKKVYNEILIGYPTTFVERSQDTWVTGQVRSQLLAEEDLNSGSIRVTTEQSVVYLMGCLSHAQANIAVNVVRNIPGVRKVVKVFQYK